MPQPPVIAPARFVPTYAVGYVDTSGEMSLVSSASPLPVTMAGGATPTVASAISGSASASTVIGPFTPTPGVPVVLTLYGTWAGTVTVKRSTNGGATQLSLTVAGMPWGVFTANVCEPVWEENDPTATLHAQIAITSGTVNYRLGH